ncbi:amino acid ABC transporter permease [Cohaesibacter gelatinilyticus]|uniref:General L-amino acid transport system permease protein n=1 Tax=Cohaesibacter gelatinilyticus TaxID=372072 RepID=A0A285NDG8_9HYPH|nr:amino acid ABC transporter permease [Cohaesibacter gelatinilyticus]SNZ07505.1 general L-amino acid transport system permease protein [Cohaesibacter gelatinilyticus]
MAANSQATKGAPSEKGSVFNDPKVRGIVYQVALVAGLAYLVWSIIQNAARNLEKQNIASGFGFMDGTAGFAPNQSLIDVTAASTYGEIFLAGLLNTLLMAVIGIFFATLVGFVMGIARLSKNWVISKIATVYIEIVRNVPLLLQIFFWYFAVLRALPQPKQSLVFMSDFYLNNRGFFMPKPIFGDGSELIGYAAVAAVVGVFALAKWAKKRQMDTGKRFPVFWTCLALLIGLPLLAYLVSGMPVTFEQPVKTKFSLKGGMKVIPEFVGLLLALTIYTGAFIAEIVRAGILAVSHGQTEAANALGLRNGPTLRLVIIPQAMRVIIPPLTSQYLNLTKNSSLAVAIAYPDIVSAGGTILNQTGQAIEVIGIWMIVYLSISLLISMFMNWYNRSIALVER